jgi:hypothetical protein
MLVSGGAEGFSGVESNEVFILTTGGASRRDDATRIQLNRVAYITSAQLQQFRIRNSS